MFVESTSSAVARRSIAADFPASGFPLPRVSFVRMFWQRLVTSLPLLSMDVAVAIAGIVLVRWCVEWFLPLGQSAQLQYDILWTVLLSLGLSLAGLYPGAGLDPVDEMRKVCLSVLTVCGLCAVAVSLMQISHDAVWWQIGLTACLWLVCLPLGRRLTRRLCSRWKWWGQSVLIFGSGAESELLYDSLDRNRSLGYRPIGILDDEGGERRTGRDGAFLGPPSLAQEIARAQGVGCAVLAMPERSSDEVLRFIDRYCCSIPHLLIVPDRADIVSPPNVLQSLHSVLGVRMTQHLLLPLPQFLKRAMDLTLTIVGGILILPLIAVIALAIRWSSPGPVFYSQRRVGYGGRHFRAWKFRTMVVDAEQQLERHLASSPELRREWERDHKLRNDPRVTAIGRFLRKTSLDELPQLYNVLVGQMSLVGPRPIVDDEVVKYGDAFRLYLRVRPGLTGLWQVSGRNDTGYDQRVRLDMHYVRNWSPWLDIHLLARTILVIAGRKGAY